MIVHIVMLKFNAERKDENLLTVKQMLEALTEKIEPLKSMEVGVDFNGSERAMDLVLTSTFETKEGLKTYATHPSHLEVLEVITKVVEYTKVVDYEK